MLIVSKKPWAFKDKITPTAKRHFMKRLCYRCTADIMGNTFTLLEMCLANELGELGTLARSQRV